MRSPFPFDPSDQESSRQFAVRIPVECDHFRGFTRVVSATELSVEADRPVDPGTEIRLSFTVPDPTGRFSTSVRCVSRVLRTESCRTDGWLIAMRIEGIEFDSLPGAS